MQWKSSIMGFVVDDYHKVSTGEIDIAISLSKNNQWQLNCRKIGIVDFLLDFSYGEDVEHIKEEALKIVREKLTTMRKSLDLIDS